MRTTSITKSAVPCMSLVSLTTSSTGSSRAATWSKQGASICGRSRCRRIPAPLQGSTHPCPSSEQHGLILGAVHAPVIRALKRKLSVGLGSARTCYRADSSAVLEIGAWIGSPARRAGCVRFPIDYWRLYASPSHRHCLLSRCCCERVRGGHQVDIPPCRRTRECPVRRGLEKRARSRDHPSTGGAKAGGHGLQHPRPR